MPRDVDGAELDSERERIFRRLQRETVEAELLQQEANLQVVSTQDGDATATTTSSSSSKPVVRYQFSGMQLLRQAAFGGCLGSITGAVFGFMDGMRTAGESPLLKKASPVAQGKYLMESTRRSATLFGLFFTGFQVGKYAIRVAGDDPGDVAEIVGSGAVTLGTLFSQPKWRAAVPYAIMLMAMDSFQAYTRHTNNTGSRPT
jgi:hypothetical protein